MDTVSIGLDIGSTAVRAAEVAVFQDRRVLRRYAQVGLPNGAVVDGEPIDIPVVAEALRRLWLEGGFSSRKVVLGISGPRVIVRQADVAAMNPSDLRSSLKFDAQELVPIPMEDTSFDFSVLEELPAEGKDATSRMRILLVAAHRDLLRNCMALMKMSGLEAAIIDAAPLALMRAVPTTSAAQSGVDAIVSIGGDLTTVAVRENGVPKFIRTLTVGGSNLTESIVNNLHLELAVAETLKRGRAPEGAPQLSQARKAMSSQLRDLAEDVRATLDFFVAQSSDTEIENLVVTGGASQTAGLAAAVGSNLPLIVHQLDPFAGFDKSDLALDPEQVQRASYGAATAIGLALWHSDSPLIRLSVLPEEVELARKARRTASVAALGVGGFVALLAAIGAGQLLAVHSAKSHLQAQQQQIGTLTSQDAALKAKTAAHSQAQAQAKVVVTSLQGDIDWVRLLGQLSTVMPPGLQLTSFAGGRDTSPAKSAAAPHGSPATTPSVGKLTFQVAGNGGLPAVSAWLRGLQADPSLTGTWVSGITVTPDGGKATFSSSSDMTSTAQSNRVAEVTP